MSRLVAGQSVLAICTGNICRSPFAEHYIRTLAEDLGLELGAGSAGTHALVGYPAPPEAIEAADGMGVDLRAHAARQLTAKMLRSADMVVAMEDMHRELIQPLIASLSAGNRPRIEVLEVGDPYLRSREVYRMRYEEIAKRCRELMGDLLGPGA
ncbi:MAG: low molecular weight phosphatase family protein [Planctomycetota bacterium]